MVCSQYKNARVTTEHAKQVVHKAWLLFLRWEDTQMELDWRFYEQQHALAVRAINQLPEDERVNLELPT
jgi:hypothetical protein